MCSESSLFICYQICTILCLHLIIKKKNAPPENWSKCTYDLIAFNRRYCLCCGRCFGSSQQPKLSIDSRDGTQTVYYLQIATFLCNAALWMNGTLTNLLSTVLVPVRSGPLNVGYTGLKMAIFGSVRVGENFIRIFCNRDEKIITWRGGPGSGCQ